MIGEDKTVPSAGGLDLAQLGDVETKQYTGRFIKDHPYLEDETINREELPDELPWLGDERERAGFKDQRIKALERDDWTCQNCGANLSDVQPEVHHKKPVREFSNPKEANRLRNLISLCAPCHKDVTDYGEW